jgi:methionyl-tRNA formyltransferase
MKIGIISGSDQFIPLAYTLAANRLQVCIYYNASEDPVTNQRTTAFITATRLPFTQEITIDDWLSQEQPEIIFVFGYKHLLDVNLFAERQISVYNIHFGPLPSFRGPVPVFWQLKQGAPTLGLTIHHLSEKFDDGPVVWEKEIPDQPHFNYAAVHQIFSQLCIEGVFYILKQPPETISITARINAYQRRPQLKDVMISWQQMSCKEICNLVRACNPWNKGAQTVLNKQIDLKLVDAVVTDRQTDNLPGTIFYENECCYIACADGRTIRVSCFYMNDAFIPAYYAREYGLLHKSQLG